MRLVCGACNRSRILPQVSLSSCWILFKVPLRRGSKLRDQQSSTKFCHNIIVHSDIGFARHTTLTITWWWASYPVPCLTIEACLYESLYGEIVLEVVQPRFHSASYPSYLQLCVFIVPFDFLFHHSIPVITYTCIYSSSSYTYPIIFLLEACTPPHSFALYHLILAVAVFIL